MFWQPRLYEQYQALEDDFDRNQLINTELNKLVEKIDGLRDKVEEIDDCLAYEADCESFEILEFMFAQSEEFDGCIEDFMKHQEQVRLDRANERKSNWR